MRPRPNALRPLIEVVRNGGLLLELLRKEYTVRYRQSVMGPLWAFLQPAILLALCAAQYCFFRSVTRQRFEHIGREHSILHGQRLGHEEFERRCAWSKYRC